MKQVDEMPTEGQFVAMWENSYGVFADTRYLIDGVNTVFDPINEEFIDDGRIEFPPNTKFFIAD